MVDTATPQTHSDADWMARAVELAARARGWTSPNPMVGAVVVRDGAVVSEGWHERAGEAHAEVVALDDAGNAAQGADIYVTLEPCSHRGRTPPCVDGIIASGIRRVVCAHLDPDPRVNGRGVARLREAGIAVEVGVGEQQARRLNEHYLHWKRTGRPWVTLKWAQTLDGQVATGTGSSQWITGEAARKDAHRQRSEHDAVLVGIGTALADDPALDVRHVDGHQPAHIVLDPSLELPDSARLVVPDRTTIVCGEDASTAKAKGWERRGVRVVRVPNDGGNLDLDATLTALGAMDILGVLVEGGPTVATALIRAGLVNRVIAYIAPKIAGTGRAAVGDLATELIGNALQLRDAECTPHGDDWRVTGLLGDD